MLLSWNVASLNARLDEVKRFNNIDFLCIQETKYNPDKYDKWVIDGYYKYQTYSTMKKGYSGVSIFTKVKPINVISTLDPFIDEEGRFICLEFDEMYLINVYVPNAAGHPSSRKFNRPNINYLKGIDYRLYFDYKLQEFIKTLNKKIVLCGDFNCAYRPDHVWNPNMKQPAAGYSPWEIDSFNKYITDCKLKIVDKHVDESNWWTYHNFRSKPARKNGWKIDYIMTNIDHDFQLNVLNFGSSDHFPLVLSNK